MSDDTQKISDDLPPGTPAWEYRVITEMKNFMKATRENFKRGLDGTLSFVPRDAQGKAVAEDVNIQMSHFVNGIIQNTVECVASVAGLGDQVEAMFVEHVQGYFKILRKLRDDDLSKRAPKKLGLVGPSGLPVGETAPLIRPDGAPLA